MKPTLRFPEIRSKSRTGTVLFLAAMTLTACVSQPLPAYQMSISNQTALAKLTSGAKYRVLHGSDPASADTSIRGHKSTSPNGGSWSAYLADALQKELSTSKNYNSDSSRSIEVTILKILLSDGHAQLSAHFIVKRNDMVLYDKVLDAENTWESSFLGVIAVQDGMSQSGAIFQQLLRKLFDDADFVRLS